MPLRASTGTFADAAAYGELIALATLWSGTESALDLAGRPQLASKVVIDVTNPLAFDQARPRLAVGHTDSGGEQVQRWLSDSRVVKAFNSIGNPFMFRPEFPGGPPDMFICGNDESAKELVAGICRDFGWSVVDVGGIDGARLLEPLCMRRGQAWVIARDASERADCARPGQCDPQSTGRLASRRPFTHSCFDMRAYVRLFAARLPLAQRQAGWSRLQMAYLTIGDAEARQLMLRLND